MLHIRYLLAVLCLAAAYFGAAKLGLSLALVNPSATAVWPPTGVAIAACLLLGSRIWPGVFLGAFLANLTTAGNLFTSLGIAGGNTLEAVVGAALAVRFAGGVESFSRARNAFRFALLAGMVAPALSATVGVTSLCLGGYGSWEEFPHVWLTWWLGDAAGAVLVGPLILLWARTRRLAPSPARVAELALVLSIVAAVGLIVFGGFLPIAGGSYPLEFLAIPGLVWVAFRYGPKETSAAVALLSAVAIFGTWRGAGPFARPDPNVSLLLLQAFMGTVAVTFLALAAAVQERNQAQTRLRVFERKQAEEELARAEAGQAGAEQRAALLEELGRLKEDVIASARHSLKTPVTAIRAYTQLLLRRAGKDDGVLSESAVLLKAIEAETTVLSELLDRLLDDSRLDSVVLRLELSAFDLREALETVIGRLNADDRVTIHTEWLEVRGEWDRNRMELVFTNLLENAFKYGPPGVPVYVSLSGSAEAVTVTVSDLGIGVAEDELPHLFERYYRSPAAEDSGAPGQGLGLYICRRVIEAHGGSITAESPGHGKGTTFRFTVPVRNSPHEPGSPLVEFTDPRPRVLLVEDEPNIERPLALLLEDSGYRVFAARTAEMAWELLETVRPSLLLSDVQLPGMDGVTLVHQIRHSPSLPPIPLILMSAFHEPAGHEADDFVSKPFDLNQILAKVRSHLNGSRPVEQV